MDAMRTLTGPRSLVPLLLVMFIFVLAVTGLARAEIKLKGDPPPAKGGGLEPDLPQVWADDQPVKSICASAATADALWFLDQHGYDGLVKHQDPADPNKTWRDIPPGKRNGDAKALVFDMARRVYGRDYPRTGKPQDLRGNSLGHAITQYLIDHNAAVTNRPGGNGLKVEGYGGTTLTYKNWRAALEAGHEVIGEISWRDAADRRKKLDNTQLDALHAITAAGWDTEDKKLVVVHGWDDHPGDQPPYKKPPYAKEENRYINFLDITIDDKGKVRITKNDDNPDNKQMFARVPGTDHISLDLFWVISPGQKAAAPGKKANGGAPERKSDASASGTTTYSYAIQNDTFDPIFQLALEVPVPFSFSTVKAPPGWLAVPWNPLTTPDVTPVPSKMSPPGLPLDPPVDQFEFSYRGILFYKDPNPSSPGGPVLSGSILEGFSYEVSDSFESGDLAAVAALSNGRSSLVDPTSDGLITQVTSTIGPVPPKLSIEPVVTSVTGSANHVGVIPAPGKTGGAQVGITEKFTFAGHIDLGSSIVTISQVLDELGSGGAGELVKGSDGAPVLPLTLAARPGSTSNAAIFELNQSLRPTFRLQIQNRDPGKGLFELSLKIDRASIPAFPTLCTKDSTRATSLITTFTFDDGPDPPFEVSTVQPWRCLDLMGGDPNKPRSLRTP